MSNLIDDYAVAHREIDEAADSLEGDCCGCLVGPLSQPTCNECGKTWEADDFIALLIAFGDFGWGLKRLSPRKDGQKGEG